MSEVCLSMPTERQFNKWLGERLRLARKLSDHSHLSAAEALGLPEALLFHYEKGTHPISFVWLRKMATLYGVPLSFFDEASDARLDPRARDAADVYPVSVSTHIGKNSERANGSTVMKVLIASPSDVGEERRHVANAVLKCTEIYESILGVAFIPVLWETHAYPESGSRPQAILNRQIVDEADVLLGIFGQRLGTPTGVAPSGTVEEIERFRAAGKPVALYFSTSAVPRNVDRKQLDAVEDYRKERQRDTVYFTYDDAVELQELVSRHLPKMVWSVLSSRRTDRATTPETGSQTYLDSAAGECLHQAKGWDTPRLNKAEKREAYGRFRERLRAARLNSGLKQTEIAEALGKTQTYVSKAEAGERRIDVVELQEFAKIYGVPLTFFQFA
jgi:transcriptional regulator with XRE-family HTH domain